MAAKIITFLGGTELGPNGRPLNQFKSPGGDMLTLEPHRPVAINPAAITDNQALTDFYQGVLDTCTADTEHFKIDDDVAGLVPEGAAVAEANLSPGIGEVTLPTTPPDPVTTSAAQGMRAKRTRGDD